MRVVAEEDRAVGAGHLERLRHDRVGDLAQIQTAHERVARAMQHVEVALARARFAIEPDLLSQQADEDDAHSERPREARQVPRDAVAERVEQEAEQAEDPDERREQEVGAEGVARDVASQTAR